MDSETPPISLVDLNAHYEAQAEDIDAAIRRVVESARFIGGSEVMAFEEEFAAYCETEHAVGLASGTAAIELTLRALGIGPGDEVITTPLTFFASGEAISVTGATPVFADVDPVTLCLQPAGVEAAITPRTRAILPVHLYGQPADMKWLLEISQHHSLALVEDAAQAHGARFQGHRVGSLGAAGCFSFFPSKNLGAFGDAGALVTNDSALAQRVRKLRDHGRASKYLHDEVGYGQRLDALQAAVLRAKLPNLDANNARRRALAQRYNELLAGADLVLPAGYPEAEGVYHLYVVRSPQRDALLEDLRDAGIEAGVHYPVPLHLQPAYRAMGIAAGAFPVAERAAAEVLSLPLYPEMTDEQQDRVVAALRRLVG